MIPDRVYIEGFLCYREGQEACFDGCTLWMLAGSNGSGKSALLDAMTFALFGQHRAGRHNARGLINSHCDGFVIEFDFRLADHRYRARRTLTRDGRPTRQICKWIAADQGHDAVAEAGGAGDWQEVAQTRTEQGFGRWINDNIALTYETFTASVLLLQGRADSLLLATPAQRHALLCEIVSMDRIEHIARLAKQRLLESTGAVKELQRQLRKTPRITEKKRHAFRMASEQATEAHNQATRQLEQYRKAIEQARFLHALLKRHDETIKSIDRLAMAISTQEDSCANHEDLAQIRVHLSGLVAANNGYQRLQRVRAKAKQQEATLCTFREQARQLQESAVTIAGQRQTTQKALDSETAAMLQVTQEKADLAMAFSALQQFDRARTHLRRVQQKIVPIRQEITRLGSERGAKPDVIVSVDDISEIKSRVNRAREDWAASQELASQLRKRLARFRSVADQKMCPFCQQPLDDVHIQRERIILSQQLQCTVELSEGRYDELTKAERDLHAIELRQSQLQERRQLHDSRCQHLRDRMKTLQYLESEDSERCAEAFRELSGPLQRLITKDGRTQWGMTTYPTEHDFTRLRAARAEVARKQQQTSTNADDYRKSVEACRQQELQTIGTRQNLGRQIQGLSKSLAETRASLEQLEHAYHALHSRLPDHWRDWSPEAVPNHILRLQQIKASQDASQVAEPPAPVETLRAEQQRLIAQRDLLESQLRQIPSNAQLALSELQTLLDKAQQTCETTHATRIAANKTDLHAGQHAEQRDKLSQRLQTAQHEHHLWTRLHTLLGPENLQYDILQSAEQAVIEYTNATLDRLTAGQLTIERRVASEQDDRCAKTLDLVIRSSMDITICQDVAFLSGSQKFRVSVALSLAIGQFASRTRQPIQAVIIDEGFGCLDTVNRQVMIQELQNLRGQLQRILLISHQDEFVNAFPDGYRCQLVNGETRLTQFHA